MKIFGNTAGSGEFGKIGSASAGTPETTKDLTLIQSLTQYFQGYFGITVTQGSSKLPRSEDLNSLFYLTTAQLAYIFNAGVPEWLDSADQEYFANQGFVSKNGSLYVAIKGDGVTDINTGKDPETESEWWRIIYTSSPVSAYKIAEAVEYEVKGVLVERYGKHYSSTGLAGNAGKDPADPVNVDYWFESPGVDLLEYFSKKGEVVPGGMHDINDRAGAQYAQDLLIDQIKKGVITYDFDRIALDGTVVTGDANLEDDILKVGTADEYPYLDIFAPDIVGTRTLLDMGEYITTPQSVSGENDTLGELQDDRFQGHWHETRIASSGTGGSRIQNRAGDTFSFTSDPEARDIVTDTVNGTPRTGLTTAPKELTEGISSIIVMHT